MTMTMTIGLSLDWSQGVKWLIRDCKLLLDERDDNDNWTMTMTIGLGLDWSQRGKRLIRD